MKKTILSLILIVLVLALTACNGASAASETENNTDLSNNIEAATENENNTDTADGERQFSMPTEIFLMLGTVKLDETDLALDAEQASQLLPLWKALRSLGESETAAQAEIDAVITQIENGLTSEQISALEAMELTMQDMGGVAETLGVELGNLGGGFGEITPEMKATREAARESGDSQGRGNGLGPGSGQGPGSAEIDPAARETAMAERGGTWGARSGINSVLLDAIIEFLAAKAQ